MATQNNIEQQLMDLLVTKNFQPEMKDKNGQDARDTADAKLLTFDYVGASGKNYGTMVIVLDQDNDLKIMYGDNLGRTMVGDDKDEFFDFIVQVNQIANRNRWTHTVTDLSKLKYVQQGLAAIQEGLFEGYYGTRKISYTGEPTGARLMIKHNHVLGENDKRYRYVESLYIETVDSERFKLGFKNLAGGHAMLEHVRQGGKPYDIRGNHITEMIGEIAVLNRFNRASQGRVMEGVTAELITEAQHYYKSLREDIKRMSHSRGYTKYFESWHPAVIADQEGLVEDIKTMFIEQTLDARIEAALPVLARLQQGKAMKEADIFENWANHMVEGTWAMPETPEAKSKLNTLLMAELPVGPDAINATEQLYDVLGDDELFDNLADLARQDPDADARPVIIARMEELGMEVPDIEGGQAASDELAPISEGDNLATFESPNCNSTMEGEYCPEHGLMECGSMYEGVAEATPNTLSDIRARMDARRNPAAATPVAQPATVPVPPKFKVGDTVSFAIGRGIPSTGTITAVGPGPTQLTVKTAKGENQLDTRMKSLYLQLAPAAAAAPAPAADQEPTLDFDDVDTQEPASPAVDAKGRTQDQWEKAVMAKYPDAQIQKSMGIDSPMLAILPDGRRLSWKKAEAAVAAPVAEGDTEFDASKIDPETKCKTCGVPFKRHFTFDANGNITHTLVRHPTMKDDFPGMPGLDPSAFKPKPLVPGATPGTSNLARPDPTPDLPRATMTQNKTTGEALIQYNGKSYQLGGKAPEGATGTRVFVPAAAFGIRSMGNVIALLTDDGTAHAERPLKVYNTMYQQAKQGVTEAQLDEGAMETITSIVQKIPGIGKYFQMAQQYKPQLIEILKTSKSGKEVKQKMEQLASQAPVAESGMMKQLGGVALGGGSILSTMWMNAMGMIDGVLAHAAAGEVGGAVASGSILGLIPVTLMLFAAMLLFKGSTQSSQEKAEKFQAQRSGMREANDDPINYNAAITGSYYESKTDPLARIKSLALRK